MFGIGWGELAVIFVLVLILFGPDRAQSMFRAFGRGIKEFKDAMADLNANNVPKTADFQQKQKVNEQPKASVDSPKTDKTDEKSIREQEKHD